MTPAEALAALRAAEARDGAPNLTQRRAMLLSLAREVKKRAPDIMAVAKALGGGFPIGACLARGASRSTMSWSCPWVATDAVTV